MRSNAPALEPPWNENPIDPYLKHQVGWHRTFERIARKFTLLAFTVACMALQQTIWPGN